MLWSESGKSITTQLVADRRQPIVSNKVTLRYQRLDFSSPPRCEASLQCRITAVITMDFCENTTLVSFGLKAPRDTHDWGVRKTSCQSVDEFTKPISFHITRWPRSHNSRNFFYTDSHSALSTKAPGQSNDRPPPPPQCFCWASFSSTRNTSRVLAGSRSSPLWHATAAPSLSQSTSSSLLTASITPDTSGNETSTADAAEQMSVFHIFIHINTFFFHNRRNFINYHQDSACTKCLNWYHSKVMAQPTFRIKKTW